MILTKPIDLNEYHYNSEYYLSWIINELYNLFLLMMSKDYNMPLKFFLPDNLDWAIEDIINSILL